MRGLTTDDARDLEKFVTYCWTFYGPTDGIYPIKGLTIEMMVLACAWVTENGRPNDPEWPYQGGDTDDRLSACEALLMQNPTLASPYS